MTASDHEVLISSLPHPSASQQLSMCPPHFTKVEFDESVVDAARIWLYENLTGRFYLGALVKTDGRILKKTNIVGFEEPAEATLFNLIKDTLGH